MSEAWIRGGNSTTAMRRGCTVQYCASRGREHTFSSSLSAYSVLRVLTRVCHILNIYYEAGNNCLKKFPAKSICWDCFYACVSVLSGTIQPIIFGFVVQYYGYAYS